MINHSLPIAVIFFASERRIIWRAVTDVIATGTSVRRFRETSIWCRHAEGKATKVCATARKQRQPWLCCVASRSDRRL